MAEDKKIPIDTMEYFSKNFEKPSNFEGFSKITTWEVETCGD